MKHLFAIFSLTFLLSSTTVLAKEGESQYVTTTVASYQDVQDVVLSVGVLANKKQQSLSFKVGGIVSSLLVEEGQTVSANQTLAVLDQEEIKAQVKQARSVYQNNVNNLKRFSSLYKDKVITQEQYQAAQTQVDVAKSALQIAQFNLKHAVIRAQDDGMIITRMVEESELVSPNQPIFLMSNDKQGWVLRVGLTDKDIVKIREGNTAQIKFDAYPNEIFKAAVSEIGAAALKGGLFEIELLLAPSSHKLFAGFIGKVSIQADSTQTVALIPIESIVEAQQSNASIFIVENDKAVKRSVKVAYLNNQYAAILDGIENHEEVVVAGATYLREGMQVVKE